MSDPQLIGTCSDFIGLQAILRERKDKLQISNTSLETIAGLCEGHINKLLAPVPSKNLGVMTCSRLLKALGLKLNVVEDPDQMARLAGHIGTRREQQVRNAPPVDPVKAYLIRQGRKGGRARWRSMTPEEQAAFARTGAMARWHPNGNSNANGNGNGHT